jgi:hypothetical protein
MDKAYSAGRLYFLICAALDPFSRSAIVVFEQAQFCQGTA